MVDPVSFRLSLSATEVKELTGWPDAMVEDYIQILEDLTDIINDLNNNTSNITQLFTDYANINSDLSGVRTLAAKVRAKNNALSKEIKGFSSQIANLKQQQASSELAKVRARLVQSVRDYKSWLPAKTVLLRIEGAGAGNPTVTNDYNVASVTRTGAGIYEVTVSQPTYFTVNALANSVFAHSSIIDPLTSSYQVETVVTGTSTFEIRVYELTVSGAAVQRGAYDILAGDFVDVQALFSINDNLPPR